jgi:hypothetical protein
MARIFFLFFVGLLPAFAVADDTVDFATEIRPIFTQHCTKCHGERVAKGELRLHTAETIRETGVDYLFSPENPDDGELLIRLTLPADDELHMPKGSDSLPEETIALLRRWASQGAALADDAPQGTPAEDELPDVLPAAPEAIARLEAAGVQVFALFQGSPLLRITFAYADEKVGDDAVALLADVAPQVVWLDLARSNVTDAGLAPLAALENLSHVHLEQTSIGDNGLTHLAGLGRLEYVNLYGTQVTDAGLEHLAKLPQLKNLYLWQTPVSYDAAMALAEETDGLDVNLGWDHPEVARRRLSAELTRVQTEKEDATRRLEEAQRQQKVATEREAEIQKELAEIEGGSEETAPTEDSTKSKDSSTEQDGATGSD